MAKVISMEVDDDDSVSSEYRILAGKTIKYLTIHPGTLERDILSFPLASLELPYDERWNAAEVSRDSSTGKVQTSLTTRVMAGVANRWHSNMIDFLEFERTKQLTAHAFEATCRSAIPGAPAPSTPVIVKAARFEWEIPYMEQETRAYQLLNNTDLAPEFLGHVHEHGRIIGFVLQKIEGRHTSYQDREACERILMKFHALGLVHGDVNRYNFIITGGGIKLIDFSTVRENASKDDMKRELETLQTELRDESGRGGGFRAVEE